MHAVPMLTINDQPVAAASDIVEWQPVSFACAPVVDAREVRLRVGASDLGPPSLRFADPCWRWEWNPQNNVGLHRGVLSIDGHELAFTIRALPSKLSQEHYERLLLDVQAIALELTLALGGAELDRTGVRVATPAAVLAYWPQLQKQVGEVIELARHLARQSHQVTEQQLQTLPLHEVEEVDGRLLQSFLHEPLADVHEEYVPALQALLRPMDQQRGGPLPQHVRARRTTISRDCEEHRLLRAVTDRLFLRLIEVGEILRGERQRLAGDGPALQHLDRWRAAHAQAVRQMRKVNDLPLLAEVAPATHCARPTHLMRHHPGYRRVYALWQALREQPQLGCDSPLFFLPLADLPLLYEQWCVLQIAGTLMLLGDVEHQQLIEPRGDRRLPWGLRIREDQPLLTVCLPHGARVTLYYHRRYAANQGWGAELGSLDPFTRIPDMALEVRRKRQAPRTLLLDAKYRLMPDGTLPQTALDTAYTYGGAIGYGGERASLGAWLLFPGSTAIIANNIGALPLLPGATEPLEHLLRSVLSEERISHSASNNHD